MRSVRIALAVGLGVSAAAVCVVLSESPLTVAATNSAANEEIAATNRSSNACQTNERLPRGTVAIRLSLGAFTGPKVMVKALSDSRIVASGERGSGWDGQTVTIPVKAVSETISPATICFTIATLRDEEVAAFGKLTRQAIAAHAGNGKALPGRLKIEYLRRGRSSWLTLASSVARRMGLGRAWGGTWIVLLMLTLMLAAIVLASRLMIRELCE
jgi:hypothetical protein